MRTQASLALALFLSLSGCQSREERVVEKALAAGRHDDSAVSLARDFAAADEKLLGLGARQSRARLRQEFAGFARATWTKTQASVLADAAREKPWGTADDVGHFIAALGDDGLKAQWKELKAQADAAARDVRARQQAAEVAQAAGTVLVTGDLPPDFDGLQRALASVTSAPLRDGKDASPDVRDAAAGQLQLKVDVRTRVERRARQMSGRPSLAKAVVGAAKGDVEVKVVDTVSASITFTPKGAPPKTWTVETNPDEMLFPDARERIDVAPLLAWPTLCRKLEAAVAE